LDVSSAVRIVSGTIANRRSSAASWRVGIRSGVERGFATIKRYYGYRWVRYIGLARNRRHLNLMCAAINLRRALVLAA